MRLQDRSGNANGRVEARVGGGADDPHRVAVEEDDHPVVRRVLELLDHELSATGARRPVHAAQRLALLVLADRVEVESGGTPQEQPPSVAADDAGVAEEAVERDEPGPDDERRPLERDRRLDGREAEEIADHDLSCIDRMDPARHAPEVELGREDAPMAPKAQRPRSEPADLQLDRARAEQDPRRAAQLRDEYDAIALRRRFGTHVERERDGSLRKPGP